MTEDKQMPEPPPTTTTTELTEKGSVRGSAGVVGLTPSDQFITPTMNLDGPPTQAAPTAEQPAE